MKKLKKKGDYGYLASQQRYVLLKTILYFVSAFGIIVLGLGIYGTKANLFTVVGMLSLLPAAKSLVNLIITLRAKCAACPEPLYTTLNAIAENAPEELHFEEQLQYDFYMTTAEQCYPIYSFICLENCILGICTNTKVSLDKAEKHITDMVRQNGLKVQVVKLFHSEEKYIKRVEELAAHKDTYSAGDLENMRLMKNLCI